MTIQWCAQCGQEMTPRDDGARNQCCEGFGYWTRQAPLARDAWADEVKDGYHLYRSGRNPPGWQPVSPS